MATSWPRAGVDLPVLRRLGYGRCRLAAAAPADSPYEAIADLAGVRIATSHPNVTRRFFADQGIPVEVISLSGAVEVAPRLGLADAIVDLVSTGSTLAMNGLRAIGDILASEAILVTNAAGRPRSAPPSSTASSRCSAPSSRPAAAST